jgi:acyl-CoA synthetase (AMP-forming)/AMP-acid ligase II
MLSFNPLLQSLNELAQSDPRFTVLVNSSKKISAQELMNRTQLIATNLSARGFMKNDMAVMAVEPGEEFLEILNAVIMLQGKIAIIDPEMGRENYAAKMKQLQPQWMFIDSRLLFLHEHPFIKWILLLLGKNLPQLSIIPGVRLITVGRKLPILRKHIFFRTLFRKIPKPPGFRHVAGLSENVIIYTSGTTSVPKGVLHTGKSLAASIKALQNLLTVNHHSIVGTSLPHFMLLGIAAGLTVKMKKKNMTTASYYEWLKEEKIGILFGPPSDYLPLIQYSERKDMKLPFSLEHIIIGSAPVHIQFLKRLGAVLAPHTQVTCTYGMTENLLVATVDGLSKSAFVGRGDLVGKPVKGVFVKIAEDGEIMVRSNQLFARYFHEEEGPEWHQTGDLGEMDKEGNIILLGRKKEMIIRRNMNIYPALFENTVKHIKGVEEAAMVGVYDETIHDEKVYLALEGSSLNIGYVQNQLKQGEHSIDREALPDCIFQMAIPRKGRQNKIDRITIVEYIKKNGL